MTDEINRWKVGNVKITRVVEMEGGFPPGAMFNGLTADQRIVRKDTSTAIAFNYLILKISPFED